MAEVGALDFRSFVEEHKKTRVGGPDLGGHSYAYVSDHNTRRTFARMRPVQLVIESGVRYFRESMRGRLLGSAVRVGPKQFPRLHRLAQEASSALGIGVPTVYLLPSPVMNAGTYGTPDDSFILVHSSLFESMSDDELRFVIGHECGHMHNNHVVYLTAMHILTQLAGFVLPQGVGQAAAMALAGWSRRAEITCDRAGLLCNLNLKAATSALTKLAIGSAKLHAELNVEAFVEQSRENRENIGRFAELSASHPWVPKRVLALRAFAESELYRKQAGLSGGLGMTEVDAKVHEIIQVK